MSDREPKVVFFDFKDFLASLSKGDFDDIELVRVARSEHVITGREPARYEPPLWPLPRREREPVPAVPIMTIDPLERYIIQRRREPRPEDFPLPVLRAPARNRHERRMQAAQARRKR